MSDRLFSRWQALDADARTELYRVAADHGLSPSARREIEAAFQNYQLELRTLVAEQLASRTPTLGGWGEGFPKNA